MSYTENMSFIRVCIEYMHSEKKSYRVAKEAIADMIEAGRICLLKDNL